MHTWVVVFRMKTTSKKTTFHGWWSYYWGSTSIYFCILAIITTHYIIIMGLYTTGKRMKQVKVLDVFYNIVCNEQRSDFLSVLLPSLPFWGPSSPTRRAAKSELLQQGVRVGGPLCFHGNKLKHWHITTLDVCMCMRACVCVCAWVHNGWAYIRFTT